MPSPAQDDHPSLPTADTTPETRFGPAPAESSTAVESPTVEPDDDVSDTLIERLDRRQNQVLRDLDTLNAGVEQLVTQCQQLRPSQRGAA